MKKGFKLFTSAIFALTIAGCSCSNPGVETYLPDSKEIISGSKTDISLTTQDIYEYVRNNNFETYNKIFMTKLIKNILKKEFKNNPATLESNYEYKLKKYFTEEYLEKDEFKVDGQFSEKLLVAYLKDLLYKINDPINDEDAFTYKELGLTYDYSDYIEAEVDYLIYMDLLKEHYISVAKPNILDKSRTRIVTIYSTDNLEDMEEVVEDIFSGKYDSIEDLEKTKIDEAEREIGRQFCENLGQKNEHYLDEEGKIIETCSPTKNSYDSAYTTFTTCANGRKCDIWAGLAYQIEQVRATKYLEEQVVNKDTTDILYENALSLLLREDVEDYLVSDENMADVFVSDDVKGKFLMSNLANGEKFDKKSIILSSAPGSTCYIVLVRTVDSESDSATAIDDKRKALELLLGKAGETSVLLHYLDKTDVELIDSKLVEAYKTLIK